MTTSCSASSDAGYEGAAALRCLERFGWGGEQSRVVGAQSVTQGRHRGLRVGTAHRCLDLHDVGLIDSDRTKGAA